MQITPTRIAEALETAPPSLLLGLMVRDPRLRERSLRDPRLRERSRYGLAEVIANRLEEQTRPDPNQLLLLL